MSFVAIIAFICGLISIVFFKKKWYNPVTIFSFLWGIVFFLYSIKLLPYYEVSTTVSTAFFLQIIAFTIGGVASQIVTVVLRKNNEQASFDSSKNHIECKLNYKILYVFCAISIFLLLQGTVDVIKNLMSGMTFYEMTHEDLIAENDAVGITAALKIFVLFPTSYAISAITAIELMFKQGKKPWGLFVMNIIIIVLYSLQHGARVMLVVFAVSYIFAYVLSKKLIKGVKPDKKMKSLVNIMCLLSIVFAVFLSISRGIEFDELGLSLYKYLSGCVPNFDYWIDSFSLEPKFTYGLSSIYGFLSPVVILLKGVGIINGSPYLYKLAGRYIAMPEEVSIIGNNVGFNAFLGHNYVFYVDFGLVGVFVGNLIYGYIISNIFNIIHRRTDSRLNSLYVLLISSICLSFVRFAFCQYHYAMALVLCFFIYRKEKISNDNN